MGRIRSLLDAPDIFFAFIGVMGGLGVTLFATVMSGRLVFLPIGVLVLAVSGGWFVLRERFDLGQSAQSTQVPFYALGGVVLSLLFLSEVAWFLRPEIYQRPLLFFVLVSVAVGLMAVQALGSTRAQIPFFLAEVVLLGLSLAWSQLFIFPGLIGEDPWYHQFFTREIIETSFVPPGMAYSGLPLFHLTVADAWLLSAPTYKIAAVVSVSLALIVVNVLVCHQVGDELAQNHRVGLMAALLVAVANQSIFMSTWSIPNGFAALFIPVIVYLLIFRGSDPVPVRAATLGLSMAAVIMTHSVTAVCTAVVLFVLWSISAGYRRFAGNCRLKVPWFVPVAFLVGMIGWWYLATNLIATLADLVTLGFRPEFFDKSPTELRLLSGQIPLGEQVFNYLGYFLFFSLALLGILALIKTRESARIGFSFAGVAPLVIGFGSLVAGLAVLYERWWYFSEILLAVPAGLALIGLFTMSAGGNRHRVAWAAIGALVMVLAFVLITSPPANVDNHEFSPNSAPTFALRSSEMQAVFSLVNLTERQMRSDEYLVGSMTRLGFYIEPFDRELYAGDLESLQPDMVIVRRVINTEPFKIFSTNYRPENRTDTLFEAARFARVYDDGAAAGYAHGFGFAGA